MIQEIICLNKMKGLFHHIPDKQEVIQRST